MNERPGWAAQIDLMAEQRHGRPVLTRRCHAGPLRIQKPFYPEDGACHVYLLHPPGGVVGGDRLDIRVEAATNAQLLITTPAATKIYRSPGAGSEIDIHIRAADGASVEWLPMETLLFGASRLHQTTTVELSSLSRFCGWEMVSLGRPMSGDDYSSGQYRAQLRISVNGIPALVERLTFSATDDMMTAPWGLSGHRAFGALYAYPADRDVLTHVRQLLEAWPDEVTATLVDGFLVIRSLTARSNDLRERFMTLWQRIRQMILGLAPCPPRIWAT